jgi:hypothetical protein
MSTTEIQMQDQHLPVSTSGIQHPSTQKQRSHHSTVASQETSFMAVNQGKSQNTSPIKWAEQ